jgi:hypothetical protein
MIQLSEKIQKPLQKKNWKDETFFASFYHLLATYSRGGADMEMHSEMLGGMGGMGGSPPMLGGMGGVGGSPPMLGGMGGSPHMLWGMGGSSPTPPTPHTPPIPIETPLPLVFAFLTRNQQFAMRTVCRDWRQHAMSQRYVRFPETEQLYLYTMSPINRVPMTMVYCDYPIDWSVSFGSVRHLVLHCDQSHLWQKPTDFFDALAALPQVETMRFRDGANHAQNLTFTQSTQWHRFARTIHTISFDGWYVRESKDMRLSSYPPSVTLVVYERLIIIVDVEITPCVQYDMDNRVVIRRKPRNLFNALTFIIRKFDPNGPFQATTRFISQECDRRMHETIDNAHRLGISLFDPELDWSEINWSVMDWLIRNKTDQCMSIYQNASNKSRALFRLSTYLRPSLIPTLTDAQLAARNILRGKGGLASPL